MLKDTIEGKGGVDTQIWQEKDVLMCRIRSKKRGLHTKLNTEAARDVKQQV